LAAYVTSYTAGGFATGEPTLEGGYYACAFSTLGAFASLLVCVRYMMRCFTTIFLGAGSDQQMYTFDLSPLQNVNGYVFSDSNNNTYDFNICGETPQQCVPPYEIQYQTANAMLYFGSDPSPGSQCQDKSGNKVPCTRNCEALGVGPAANFQLLDASNVKTGGVQFSYYGVGSL
jgi:hypothetical protein